MYGAIAGDICGSSYEFSPCKDPGTLNLFSEKSRFTDDTVVLIGVYEALSGKKDLASTIRQRCLRIGNEGYDIGYGLDFLDWIMTPTKGPYDSCGNGSAMRVPSIPYMASSIVGAANMARKVSEISHNHPEGIRGAQAVAVAMRMALEGWTKQEIANVIKAKYGYDLSRGIEEIRENYIFEVLCQKSVPEAISCILQSDGYEDTIRNTISLGGDADTQACIAGALWEAKNGAVPASFKSLVHKKLPKSLNAFVQDFYAKTEGRQYQKTSPDKLEKWVPPVRQVDLGSDVVDESGLTQQQLYEREMERMNNLLAGSAAGSGQKGFFGRLFSRFRD